MLNENNLLVKIYGVFCLFLSYIQSRIKDLKHYCDVTKEVIKQNPDIGYKEINTRVNFIINEEKKGYKIWD